MGDKNLAKSPASDQGLGCDNMTLMTVDLHGLIVGAGRRAPGSATRSARCSKLRAGKLVLGRRKWRKCKKLGALVSKRHQRGGICSQRGSKRIAGSSAEILRYKKGVENLASRL